MRLLLFSVVCLLSACATPPSSTAGLELPPVPVVEGIPVWRLNVEGGCGSCAPVGPHTLLTAAHVVVGHEVLTVERGDRILPVVDVLVHPELDAALVRVDEVLDPVPLHEGRLRFGDRVVAVGLVVGRYLYASDGIVTFDGLCSAPIARGMSGGPVMTPDGEIVGVVSAALVQRREPKYLDHVHKFTPVSEMREWLRENIR